MLYVSVYIYMHACALPLVYDKTMRREIYSILEDVYNLILGMVRISIQKNRRKTASHLQSNWKTICIVNML